jgi:hypothetical protein
MLHAARPNLVWHGVHAAQQGGCSPTLQTQSHGAVLSPCRKLTCQHTAPPAGKGGNALAAESRWGAPYPTQFKILLDRAVRVRRFQAFSTQDILQFLVIGAPRPSLLNRLSTLLISGVATRLCTAEAGAKSTLCCSMSGGWSSSDAWRCPRSA